ncbi:Uu.00g112910.m01.CDS01 [Anthostomella pinea]|uniref:Uu.00g112910.m01.CDS01 n=1 Tax=Anthostomella pinea TaxID=933095 RepID=A0AAI8VFF5_9PEZI|nr:Uu.00g112910.m01.CDS01 [Anthostomella pinea]
MAPNFRPNRETRRGNRSGYVEHDDFEGLPVRQWRQEWVTITPPPPPHTTQRNDVWAIELPHGMPRDSQLLPQHTQELLRAARSGRLYKRPAPAEEEDADADTILADKADKKDEDPTNKGFQVKIWKQVARNAEGPTVSHLAKRRKGTVTLSSDLPAGAASGVTVTKATVRRVDAAGNPYTQEITLNEGQQVDGEIIATTVVAVPTSAANGDATASATPVRRRPPPPKRKPKGPGRGRKKKVPLPLPARPDPPVPGVSGVPEGIKTESAEANAVKPEDNDATKNQDSEMADDDEEGDDGEDDGEDGEEGDEGDEEDGEGENGSVSRAGSEIRPDGMDVSPTPNQPESTGQEAMVSDVSGGQKTPLSKDPILPLSHVNLPPIQPPYNTQPSHFEGSPLKNVIAAPSPLDLMPKLSPTIKTPGNAATAAEVGPSSVTSVQGLTAEPVPSVEASATPEVSGRFMEQTTSVETEGEVDADMVDGVPAVVVEQTQQTTSRVSDARQPSSLPVEETPGAAPVDVATIVQTDAPVMSVESTVTEVVDEPRTEEVATLAADPIDTQVGAAGAQATEEQEPDSPDLFSGLEAALNLPGPSNGSTTEAPPKVRSEAY